MIKLTIEMKDEKFFYSYDISGSTQSGECPLTPESFSIFTASLDMAQKAYINRQKEWFEEIKAKAYIEKHPELLTNQTEW